MKKSKLKKTSMKVIAGMLLAVQLFSIISVLNPRSGGVQTMGEIEEDLYCIYRF